MKPGERYGRLVAIEDTGKVDNRQRVWDFVCDCGVKIARRIDAVRSQNVTSCGCYRVERVTTHGHRIRRTRTYLAWTHAKARCYNPKDVGYANYGGRGISMCDDWRNSFENFLACMGE